MSQKKKNKDFDIDKYREHIVTSLTVLKSDVGHAREKLIEWDRNGYNIILLTGRKESLRKVTEDQLSKTGIFYDQLIMGVGGGKRYLINDWKLNSTEDYAIAINLKRNTGIKNLEI